MGDPYALDPSLEQLIGNLRASRERFRQTTENELRQLQTDMAGLSGRPVPSATSGPTLDAPTTSAQSPS